MDASQLDEAWRGTDVLVDRIAVLVGGNHTLARHVRHRRRELLERHGEQLSDELLRRASREHVGERRELRGVIDRQTSRVASGGAWCGRTLAPALEQILETHGVYSVERTRARGAHSSVASSRVCPSPPSSRAARCASSITDAAPVRTTGRSSSSTVASPSPTCAAAASAA